MINCGLIAQALEAYDGEAEAAGVEAAEVQRAEVLERFPRSSWPELPLERYALGQEDKTDNFCRWMEFRATDLGSIKGGSARKHHIYLQRAERQWWFEHDRYPTVEEAWAAVRGGFVEALERAATGEWDELDRIPALRGGPALLAKTLHLYFPDEILPVYSHAHLTGFLEALGEERRSFDNRGTVSLNRHLLAGLRACGELRGWSTKEMERLLYASGLYPFEEDERRSARPSR
jgi:5-methylcytosine-specific restriction protein B